MDLERAVEVYVEELLVEELLREAGPGRAPSEAEPAAAPPPVQTPFRTPVLSKFDDMNEMLLLDPVHDVAETGWPAPRDEGGS